MSILNLAALDATPLQRDPFDFIVVSGFLDPEALQTTIRDYPDITDPRNHDPDDLSFGPVFGELLDEIRQPVLARRIGAKFGVDLQDCTPTITVRKFCERSDGHIHTDHWSKIVTLLIYFNAQWPHEEGRLRMLRSAQDIEDYAAEVQPLGGTMLAFRRSDHSFHGHTPFVGERRMLQMNWIKPTKAARYTQKLARFSTHAAKRLFGRGADAGS